MAVASDSACGWKELFRPTPPASATPCITGNLKPHLCLKFGQSFDMPALRRRCQEITVSKDTNRAQCLATGETFMASSTLTKPKYRLRLHSEEVLVGTHAALTSESEAEQGPERRSEAGTVISSDRTDSATAVKRSARRPRKHKPRRQSAPRTVARRTPTTVDQWQTAEALRRDQLSRLPLDVPGWDIWGQLSDSDLVMTHGGLFNWSLQDDGKVNLTAGSMCSTGLAAGLASTSLLAALRAHSAYHHTVDSLVSQLSNDLWRSSTGDQHANLLHGVLDPLTGILQFSLAGSAMIGLRRASKMEPLQFSGSSALGHNADATFERHELRLRSGDTLLIVVAARPIEFSLTSLKDYWPLGGSSARPSSRTLLETLSGNFRTQQMPLSSLLAIRFTSP